MRSSPLAGILGTILALGSSTPAAAGSVTLAGTVIEDGEPAAAVTVLATPGPVGESCLQEEVSATTDGSGAYRIEIDCDAGGCGQCFVQIEVVIESETRGLRRERVTADLCDTGGALEGIDFELTNVPRGVWRVLEVEGVVECRPEGGDWADCAPGEEVAFFTEVATGFDGRATFGYYEDGEQVAVVELEPLTVISLDYSALSTRTVSLDLEIEFGEIQIDVRKERYESDAKISAPNAVTGIRGTSLAVRAGGPATPTLVAPGPVADTVLYEGVIETELTCSGSRILSSVEPCAATALQLAYDGSGVLSETTVANRGCSRGGLVGVLESPAGVGSGVTTIHGWAFTRTPGARIERLVEIWIDGAPAFLAPCCSDRGDVREVFPEAPLRTGFASVFNLGLVSPAVDHVAHAYVRSTAGEVLQLTSDFRAVRSAAAPFLELMTVFDPAPESCTNVTPEGGPATVRLTNLEFESPQGELSFCIDPAGVEFRWDRGRQGFVQTTACVLDPIAPAAALPAAPGSEPTSSGARR